MAFGLLGTAGEQVSVDQDKLRDLASRFAEAELNPEGGAISKAASLRQQLIPTFEDNPVAALGLIISEAMRGARGQLSTIPGRLSQIRIVENEETQQQLMRQGMQLRRVGTGLNLMEKALASMKGISQDQREQFIAGIEEQAGDLGFPIGNFLRAANEGDIEQFQQDIDWWKANPDAAAFIGVQDADSLNAIISDPEKAHETRLLVEETKRKIAGKKAEQEALQPLRLELARTRSDEALARQESMLEKRTEKQKEIAKFKSKLPPKPKSPPAPPPPVNSKLMDDIQTNPFLTP